MTDTTLKEQIQHDLHDAMRARDKVRSGTLRMDADLDHQRRGGR